MTQTNPASPDSYKVNYAQVLVSLILVGLIGALVTIVVNFNSNQAEIRSRFEERTVSADQRIRTLEQEFNHSRNMLASELRTDRQKISDLRSTVLRFEPYIEQLNQFTNDSALMHEISIDLRRSVERVADRMTTLETARGQLQSIQQQLNTLQGLIERHISSNVAHTVQTVPASSNTPQHIPR